MSNNPEIKLDELSNIDNNKPNFSYLDRRFFNADDKELNLAFFHCCAQAYLTRAWSQETQRLIQENLLDRLKKFLNNGDRVLIIGSGTSSDQFQLEKLMKDGKPLNLGCFGLDIELEMLKVAKDKIDDKLVQSEAAFLPYANNSFDVVYVESVGEFFDEEYLDIFFPELIRVLKPKDNHNGIILMSFRSGDGRLVELNDSGFTKRYSTYTQHRLSELFPIYGLQQNEQWLGTGGTPNVMHSLPWINNILTVIKQ